MSLIVSVPVRVPAAVGVNVTPMAHIWPAATLVQVLLLMTPQVHPAPVIEVRVNPTGSVSVTVTTPEVAPAPLWFDTVTVYVAPLCPCVKFPLCIDVTLRDGGTIMVESPALAVAEPPPDALTEFTCGELALAPTFTVTVITG